MRIIVSDSSCLIDLRKAALLDVFLALPYEFLIPNTLFEEELLKFTGAQKKALIRAGLKIVDFPGEMVLRAREVIRKAPTLSLHDGFAFTLAESSAGCILLTGDGDLRVLAVQHGIEVHGVLWVMDELYKYKLAKAETLGDALQIFWDDPAVRLPRRALSVYLRRYRKGE